MLGGAVSRRQWSNPVPMTEVLRSAIAEVEQYSRVKLVPPVDGTLRGHAVADVIHLLAELVENATVFSAPHTRMCCCGRTWSPPDWPSRSRTAASGCPSASRTG